MTVKERSPVAQAPQALPDSVGVEVGSAVVVGVSVSTDVLGLLCLLPGTRKLVRAALVRLIASRLPVGMRPPVRVDSVRTAQMHPPDEVRTPPLVIEGEVLRGPDGRPLS